MRSRGIVAAVLLSAPCTWVAGCQLVAGIDDRTLWTPDDASNSDGAAVSDSNNPLDARTDQADNADAGTDAEASLDAADAADSSDSADALAESRYVKAVLADAPIAYWRMGETGSPTALKSMVGNVSCTVVGTPVFGVAGALTGDPDTAVRFDETSGLDCGTNFDFVDTAPFSLEAWVQADVIDTEYRFIFAKDNDPPSMSTREEYGVVLNNGYGLYFERYVAGAGFNANSSVFTAGTQFHHVVAVYTGTSLQLYIDGSFANSTGDSRSSAPKGASFFVAGNLFRGSLDEVAIYSKALSAQAIAAHHVAGK